MTDQLDFAFVADLPIAVAVPIKRATRATKSPMARVAQPALAVQSPAAQPTDLEAMAQILQSHPDFRVMRRLVPRLQWPPFTGQSVCRVLVLDTETTGLDNTRDKIIELALLRVDIDRATGLPVGAVDVYDGLEDPGMAIPKEVEQITGINHAMVAGQQLDEARVVAMLQGIDLVIAHNAGFDRPFVESRFPLFKELAWACSFADIDWKAQGRSSAKLESLVLANGWFYDAHRAEVDCHALLALLAHPLPAASHTGLMQLMTVAEQPSFRLQATNAPFDAKDRLKARGYRWSAEQKVWHTRISNVQALHEEYLWLKEHAYHQRSAVVQVEKLDSRVRYSSRPGEPIYHQL